MPPRKMCSAAKHKKSGFPLHFILLVILFFTLTALFLIHSHTHFNFVNFTSQDGAWSGDLRHADFSWNGLSFPQHLPPPLTLRIAVFSRKWPTSSNPGGMERHAQTLYTSLAARGHRVHVFTSPLAEEIQSLNPTIHSHDGEPNKWHYDKAWEIYQHENDREEFDVIHTESVAIPYWLAEKLPNLVVSWHGIAYESMHSSIYQDLSRTSDEPQSPDFAKTLEDKIPKLLKEIRFFSKYAHHVAITDSCGEILRDVYQIPSHRVHVILNGVDQDHYERDHESGSKFRSEIDIPTDASLVFGTAGRLVKDKGHPLLFEAFSKYKVYHPNVYLIVVGSGPWQSRYKELGSQVLVLGSMNPIQLKGFYNAIDIFVNPTLRPQGLDLTLMEAMMSGKPIMASRFASIKRSVIVDDEFGFMFTPNVESLYETLELVTAEGPRRLAERGMACKKYASSMFSAGKMTMAYERLFMCIKNHTFCMYP